MRTRISNALKEAMKDGDPVRVSTLRLMLTALKDREIAARQDDGPDELSEAETYALLTRMVRQRDESSRAYEQAARMELAEQERREAEIITEFLPKKLSPEEVSSAVANAIDATGAVSIRDMGKVMSALKTRYPGQLDFAAASAEVKAALA